MTTNVNNQGIAHLAFRAGGQAFCKSRRAHIIVAVDDASKWGAICKRCAGKQLKMRAAKERQAAKEAKNGGEVEGARAGVIEALGGMFAEAA